MIAAAAAALPLMKVSYVIPEALCIILHIDNSTDPVVVPAVFSHAHNCEYF